MDAGNSLFPPNALREAKSKKGEQVLSHNAKAVVEALSYMGYDGVYLGHNDLQLGIRTVHGIMGDQKLPIVCANLFNPQIQESIYSPYMIKSIGHMKIGIFGLIPSDEKRKILLSDVVLKDSIETAHAISADLKKKANVIILLSSLGHGENMEIAEKVEGIHIILEGDTNGNRTYSKMSCKTAVIDSSHEGWYLNQLDLVIKDPGKPFIGVGMTKKSITQKLTRIQTHLNILEKKSAEDQGSKRTREGLLLQRQETLTVLENYDSYNQISSKTILLDEKIPDDAQCREILSKYLKDLD